MVQLLIPVGILYFPSNEQGFENYQKDGVPWEEWKENFECDFDLIMGVKEEIIRPYLERSDVKSKRAAFGTNKDKVRQMLLKKFKTLEEFLVYVAIVCEGNVNLMD